MDNKVFCRAKGARREDDDESDKGQSSQFAKRKSQHKLRTWNVRPVPVGSDRDLRTLCYHEVVRNCAGERINPDLKPVIAGVADRAARAVQSLSRRGRSDSESVDKIKLPVPF